MTGSAGRASTVPSPEVEDVLARLRSGGGRVTRGRRAIVELLAASGHRHLSAEDIIDHVRARLPDVAESTIYRTLTALEEIGAVRHVHLAHGPATFHLAGQNHRHLVCSGCDAVVAVPASLFEQLGDDLQQRYGYQLQTEHFALTGQCRRCQQVAD